MAANERRPGVEGCRVRPSSQVAKRVWLVLPVCALMNFLVYADAENQDRFHAYQAPFLTASYAILPESDFEPSGEGSTVDTKETHAAVRFANFAVQNLNFDIGLDYQYTRYEYQNIDGRNRDLHRLQIPFGLASEFSEWKINAFIAPGVATSSNVMKDLFDEGSSDDYFFTGRVEGLRSTNSRLSWLAGIAYDRAFGEPEVYPLAGIRYRFLNDLLVQIAFPDSKLRWEPSERQTLIARLYPAGQQWHVLSDELGTDFKYHVEAIRADLWWSYRWWREVFLDLSVGYEFNRSHEFTDDLGAGIDLDVEDSMVLAIGVRARFAPLLYTHRVAR